MFASPCSRIRIAVPKFQLIINTEASYTVYCIEVIHNGKVTNMHKRYSEFYDLHRKLQKVLHIKFAFPPKRVLNKDKNLLELRRQNLELFLQAALNEVQHDIPDLLLDFLQLNNNEDFQNNNLAHDDSCDAVLNSTAKMKSLKNHQTMICFKNDIYLHESVRDNLEESILPCIVMKGCLDGIYR